MSARVGGALIDDASPVAEACAPMKASFGLLFDRARQSGAVRPDVTAIQVLAMVAALPEDREHEGATRPYLDIVLRGLRA